MLKKFWPVLLVVYVLLVIFGLYNYSQDESESLAQDQVVEFKDDLSSNLSFSRTSLPLIRGETKNYEFEIEHRKIGDTIGRYQPKYTGQVEDHPWDDMATVHMNLLLAKPQN